MKQITLIRHAQSISNAGEVTVDDALIPLSNLGLLQTEILATTFENKPELLITSPYLRAKQTATALLKKFDGLLVEEWESIVEITYLCPLKCVNTNTQMRKPMAEEYWNKCDPYYIDGSKAESFENFISRVYYFENEIKKVAQNNIVVIGHGTFFKAFIWCIKNKSQSVNKSTMSQFHLFSKTYSIENVQKISVHFTQNEWLVID